MCECLEYDDGSAYYCVVCNDIAQINARLLSDWFNALSGGGRSLLLYGLLMQLQAYRTRRVWRTEQMEAKKT